MWWPDSVFSTDASGNLGFGGLFESEWFSVPWTEAQRSWSIETQELYPIVVASQVWGKRWSSSRILIKCDNLSVVNCVNKGYSKVPIMGDLLRVFMYNSMRYNFLFRAEHVPGVDNKLADLLSRLLPQEFRRRATWADPEPVPLPPCPLLLSEEVFNVTW